VFTVQALIVMGWSSRSQKLRKLNPQAYRPSRIKTPVAMAKIAIIEDKP